MGPPINTMDAGMLGSSFASVAAIAHNRLGAEA